MSGTNHPVMLCHIPEQTSNAPLWKPKKLNNQTYSYSSLQLTMPKQANYYNKLMLSYVVHTPTNAQFIKIYIKIHINIAPTCFSL